LNYQGGTVDVVHVFGCAVGFEHLKIMRVSEVIYDKLDDY
jgi:hypothetical protein